jgi:hypothetical protein
MWPATLSIGSTSPRKRSRPRASTSSIEGDASLASTSPTSTAGTVGRATNEAGAAAGISGVTGRAFARPRA